MNPATVAEAVALARAVRARVASIDEVEIAVAPPYVALIPVRDELDGSAVRVSAQDVHEHGPGPYTGGVSAEMLRGLASIVIVGHSEVRRDRGDTDARVNAKLRRALAAGLAPIVCVGESLGTRRSGGADAFVREQVRAALDGVTRTEAGRVTIAYEPIWAIGTGVPASGADARVTVAAAREEVRMRLGPAAAEAMRVLYGGSVTGDTIAEFAYQPGIDGALVGGASLEVDEFARICKVVAEAKGGD